MLGDWKRLYTGRPGTALTTLVSGSAAVRQLKQIVLVNRSAGNASITLYAVPAGQSASDDNILIPNLVIPPGLTPISFANFTLEAQDTVQGLQTVTGAIAVHIHGVLGE
jgi:hypothetical protein